MTDLLWRKRQEPEALKRITRDDTEHDRHYYLADEVDALLAQKSNEQSDFRPDWVNYRQGHMDGMFQTISDMALEKQEPVALETIYETIIQWDEGGGKRSRRELARRIVALYTTPPQRKPLTDEEVSDQQCRRLLYGFMLDFNAVGFEQAGRNLHRSIKEAAHGIKEAA